MANPFNAAGLISAVLVNNAGNGYLSAVEKGEDGRVRKLFDTNYFGVVDTIEAVLPPCVPADPGTSSTSRR